MEILQLLADGFAAALQPMNLLFALLGVAAGTMVGVLPGLGPISAVALLLPVTFSLNPLTAMIMMAGVYNGAMYGGSTTSILLNTPGESSSVVTTLDGYQLARQGRAGSALGVAAIGSWIAATIGILLMMLMSPALARWAISFQPAEYAALMILGLTTVSGFAEDGATMVKALISMILGLMLGTVGRDLQTGTLRFTFGNPSLADGIDFLVLSLALFAVTEVLWEAGETMVANRVALKGSVYPTREDLKRSAVPMLRGGLMGFFLGVLPGVGASTSSFISYGVERSLSKHPERFGKGAIEGVAGPEAANNGAAVGAMVPLLTLGLPGSGTTAVMLGALMMFGLQPGPLLIPNNPDLFWGLIASLYLGNILLLILNLPMVRLFVKILDVPKALLLPLILVLSFIGVYALSNNPFDLFLMLGLGLLGVLMRAAAFPPAPMVLALVLGPMLEQTLRQALIISRGNPAVFVTRPVSAVILALAVVALLLPTLLAKYRKARQNGRRMPMPNLAERLAAYTAALCYDALPEASRHEAKRRVIDALGCALGAFTAEPPKIARTLARELGGSPAATLFGTPLRTAPDLAAFANGLAIRYLDYNDTFLSLEPAHPSDNIAAALAVAESEGRDGRALIEAIVLGYEVQCRLCDAASIRSRGWDHVTYGALSTALLAGKLMSLSTEALVHTLGLAATPNVALRQTRAGELSMWKGAAFANAARNGVFAALLAKHGMTGPAPIFEGVMGFMKQVSGPFELPALGGEGDGFMIDRTYIKHFPAEYHSQVAIELMLQLRAEHGLRHEEVEAIRVHTFKAGVEIIAGEPEKWRPRSRETADHSLPYCVAAALIDGAITPAQFEPERIADPYIQAFLDRIDVLEDPELTAKYPDGIPTRIEVVLKDGRLVSQRADYALGHPNNYMADSVVEQKFRAQAALLLTERQQSGLLDALWHLDEVKDLSAVLAQAVV